MLKPRAIFSISKVQRIWTNQRALSQGLSNQNGHLTPQPELDHWYKIRVKMLFPSQIQRNLKTN